MILYTTTVIPEFKGTVKPKHKWDYITATCQVMNKPENVKDIPCEIEYTQYMDIWLVSKTSKRPDEISVYFVAMSDLLY